ncbi:MAG TPA: Maf family protein [Pirellulaceae bacterium]|jgi:septum formation protein
MPRQPLVLASSSPRRRQLLLDAGYQFTIQPPTDVNEDPLPGEPPELLVRRLALAKAQSTARQLNSLLNPEPRAPSPESLILACDTVAECSGQILGKPADRNDARRMLALLRGREHRVISGLCLWRLPTGDHRLEIDITRLVMDPISEEALENYLDTNQWQGKAGAFGYQDGLDWVHILAGSESNVVGLPMQLLARMLNEFGLFSPQ